MKNTLCVETTTGGYLVGYKFEDVSTCNNVLITRNEYNAMLSTPSDSDLKFDINKELYLDITTYLLLSFVSGHVLGRIVKAFGKV